MGFLRKMIMEANILPDSNKKHSLAVRRYTEISSIQEFPTNKVLLSS